MGNVLASIDLLGKWIEFEGRFRVPPKPLELRGAVSFSRTFVETARD